MARTVGLDGLTTAKVTGRRQAGQVNVLARRSTRSGWAIVRANVLTGFNAIIGVLLAVVLGFAPLQDGLFGFVIVVNSAVGIVRELRAKRARDALALLERASVRVRRDGAADRGTATLTLFLAAAWALALVARPYTWWRVTLVAAMVSREESRPWPPSR
jgi:cation-transporting ATPase E